MADVLETLARLPPQEVLALRPTADGQGQGDNQDAANSL
jgi:hypothetical protein